MSAYTSRSSLAAYRSVAAHGGVAAADPHQLIVMLMDGVLESVSAARGAIEHGSGETKARLLHRAVAIVDELRASLNLAAGGELAANLADLYDYVARQLMRANAENRTEMLDEVSNLLRELRGAWIQIAPRQP
jgi:flagellar protein FliS